MRTIEEGQNRGDLEKVLQDCLSYLLGIFLLPVIRGHSVEIANDRCLLDLQTGPLLPLYEVVISVFCDLLKL